MINNMSKDFRAALNVVRNEIADVSTKVKLTVRAMANRATIGVAIPATSTVTKEAKMTLATMDLSEDAKLWWRSRYVEIQEGRFIIDT
ncbi:uncharacterized protein E5676_scaffold76G00370 [Cucumis melo var. makuwa]|uniref:Uncharacterized protein n=1 Tax=Cucumis melo var. makuwa TaxID=1194695 RepID=A0A5D3CBL4_CUCMM|nr:uncharacterized protein E6C27_scaffold17G001940 [Cucumis melo var. makuwa]TYK08730.1 uncharacterized protein E5676_scaffold76G00370 [Cucumis melo var. makuwa]